MSQEFLNGLVGQELTDEHRQQALDHCLKSGIYHLLIKCSYEGRVKEHAVELLEFVLSNGVEPGRNALSLCITRNWPRMLEYLLPYVEEPTDYLEEIIPGFYGISPRIVEVLLGFGIEPKIPVRGRILNALEFTIWHFAGINRTDVSRLAHENIQSLTSLCPPPDMEMLKDLEAIVEEDNEEDVVERESILNRLDQLYEFYMEKRLER